MGRHTNHELGKHPDAKLRQQHYELTIDEFKWKIAVVWEFSQLSLAENI